MENHERNVKGNNQKNLRVIGMIILLIAIVGVSYSFFNYVRTGDRNELVVGRIYMNYNTSRTLSLVGAIPRGDKDDNMYIEFTVGGLNEYKDDDIWYGIDLLYGATPENKTEQNRIRDNLLRFTLTKKIDDGEFETVIDNRGYSSIDELRMYVETIPKETNTEISHTYRLYVWISDTINVGNRPDRDYTMEEWNNIFASISIRVLGDFIDKTNENSIKVVFNADGGNVTPLHKYYKLGDTYGTLPTPVKDGAAFDGWYDSDNNNITSDNIIDVQRVVKTADMYKYIGDKTFNGISDYINTEIKLFNTSNWQRNFYMEFTIKEDNSNKTSSSNVTGRATIMSAKNEATKPWAGIDFRHNENTSSYYGKATVNDSDSGVIITPNFNLPKHVKILRINNIIYYQIDNGERKRWNDYSEFNKQFEVPVTFGAGLTGPNGSYQRYFTGTLSNILVEFISNKASLSNYEEYIHNDFSLPDDSLNHDIILTARWAPYIVFDKVTTKDMQNSTYIASYDDIISSNPTFLTQDTVGTNNNKKTVYYYKSADALEHSNVLFAGFCWQIVRTTDTGGVKMIYNGVAENNKCKTDRTATKGINATGKGTTLSNMNTPRIYGRNYDYDLSTEKFTIQNTHGLPTVWNDNTYQDLIGTYTCGDETTECKTLYYIGTYQSATTAGVASYEISEVAHYSQMGTSPFNSLSNSLSLVGYMFNKVYNRNRSTSMLEGTYMSDVSYANGVYTLKNGGTTSTSLDDTHHYICENANNCTKVRYYYYTNNSDHYSNIFLENGKTVEDALKEMINNDGDSNVNINVYNSSIKGYLDNWYLKNLTGYTKYLDTTAVYCNKRSLKDASGWSKNGTLTNMETINFEILDKQHNLDCSNITDRFSVTNEKAKLAFPIGLLSESERALMTSGFSKTGQDYWEISPSHLDDYYAYIYRANPSGTGFNYNSGAENNFAVRGVVTLLPDVKVSSGDGSYDAPYVIDTSN